VRTRLPNFAYQLQFAGPDVEQNVQGPEKIRQALIAITGGKNHNGERANDFTTGGMDFKKLEGMTKSPVMSDEELDHYVDEYMKHEAPQLRGPMNWYRVRKINYEDEKRLLEERGPGVGKLNMPVLFIGATHDIALPPIMSMGMDAVVAEGKLTRREVKASHWALWQAADEVNKYVGEWLGEVLEKKLKPSL
jgi:pimeloyl-ACP methyl ester carboxylesterase